MINLLDVDKYIKENSLLGPILSPQIYFGKSQNYHPYGLYSENFFGLEGTMEWKEKFSWVNLNCNVIHPVIYNILTKQVLKKIDLLLSGEKKFEITNDGTLVENEEKGNISGMISLYKNINKLRFSESEEDDSLRNKIIYVLYDSIKKGIFFMDKLLIIPPGFRSIYVDPINGDTEVNDITKLYQKIIATSITLQSVSGSVFDVLSYRMQLLIRDLYELIRVKTSKKTGLVRSQMLGRRIDFTSRTVIVPDPTLSYFQVGIPLRIIVNIFEPLMIHGLFFSSYKDMIPMEFHKKAKEFISKESL